MRSSSGDYLPAGEQSIKSLNRELKEPSDLVFFPGAVCECTINDNRRGFTQSQLALMLELPTETEVSEFSLLKMWIAPPATNHVAFD